MREIMTRIKKPELVAKRRIQIMKAAMDLFRKRGYHATTMREICDKSRVNRGSFYDYFGSKEDILVYIYKEMMSGGGNFNQTSREINISGWNELSQFIRSLIFVSWNKNKNPIQLLYRETISLDKKTMQEVMRIESDYVKWVAEKLRQGLNLPSINQKLEVIANSIVYFNSFIPLRGWNMRHLNQRKILDLIADMFMSKLKDLKTPV